MAKFKTFEDALSWGKVNGRDHCLPFHNWRVVKLGKSFAVAIVNINRGTVEGYAHV